MSEDNHIDTPEIDQRIIDLLNRNIDGELGATEQRELEELLAGSDLVRNLHDELKTVTRAIEEAPDLEPPAYLQNAIERQIRLPVTNTIPSSKRKGFGSWLATRWLRTGFAVTLGAVITVGVYQMGSDHITQQDAENMVGTMVQSRGEDQSVLLGSVNLDDDRLSGLVELRRLNDRLTLDVQLQSQLPAEFIVRFGDRGLEFESIGPKQDQQDVVSVTDNSVSITSSGAQNYTLRFRRTSESPPTTPMAFEFYADNRLIHTAEVSVSSQ